MSEVSTSRIEDSMKMKVKKLSDVIKKEEPAVIPEKKESKKVEKIPTPKEVE